MIYVLPLVVTVIGFIFLTYKETKRFSRKQMEQSKIQVEEIETIINELREKAKGAELLEDESEDDIADDICPECGEYFALETDFLCPKCRAMI